MRLPDIQIPTDMPVEEMPDLLRHWYLGTRARRHMMMRRFQEVDRELETPAGGTVLDIGSAWGYNVMALASMGLSAVGMDLVVDQFGAGAHIARRNGIDFVVVGGDAAAIPFDDATFDSVTMVETFEHVFETDRQKVASECFRVLRPGGRLVLSTPNYGSLVEGFKRFAVRVPWLQRRLPTMCYPAKGVDRLAYHPYRYHRPASVGDLVDLVRGAGFAIGRVKYFLFVLKNTPNATFPMLRGVERVLEMTPVFRRMAATVCVVADKPSR